jgi:hypothetical protein
MFVIEVSSLPVQRLHQAESVLMRFVNSLSWLVLQSAFIQWISQRLMPQMIQMMAERYVLQR